MAWTGVLAAGSFGVALGAGAALHNEGTPTPHTTPVGEFLPTDQQMHTFLEAGEAGAVDVGIALVAVTVGGAAVAAVTRPRRG